MSYPIYPEPEDKLPEDPDLTDIVDLSVIEIEGKGEDAVIKITK